MLRLTKNVALPTLRCFSSRITIDNINQKIRTADYAVRGEVVIRAIEIDNEMKKGKKFPFDSLLYCNVGNPQAIKQKPITFLREVLCITSWPEVADKHPEMFHPDALQRAKELLAANPGLTKLLEDSIGPGFKQDASELKKFEKFADDSAMLDKLAAVKRANKVNFANYLEKATGQVIDPDSIFDCQVKRMHEYKRQHLNAMNIAAEYLYLKANPNADFVPKTYIFGAKAAPGYYMAKQMIRMICKLGKLIDNDPAVKDKLRIVYLEDYCVSLSERLMPASEVSEQISLAGTEASGTGNMKFMLNGAITLGTLDGANVEIADAAGKDNEIIFGMLTPEVNALKGMGYHPQAFISDDNVAMAVLDMLEKGWNGENFSEVTNNLRNSDPYMVLADFKDYRRAQHTVQELYKQKQTWNRMSLMNISNAGIFSADRSIMDYSRDIWGATPVK